MEHGLNKMALKLLRAKEILLEETAYSKSRAKKFQLWKISFLGSNNLVINTKALNIDSWMDTSFPYWEGPISAVVVYLGLAI